MNLIMIVDEFEKCQKVIYQLMKRDSFIRFGTSSLCKELLKKMKELEEEQREEAKVLKNVDLL